MSSIPKQEQDARAQISTIAQIVDECVPQDVGFIVLTIDRNPEGMTRCASNYRRGDCIKALKDFLLKMEAAEDSMQRTH